MEDYIIFFEIEDDLYYFENWTNYFLKFDGTLSVKLEFI